MSEVPDVEVAVTQGGRPVQNSGLLRTHVVIGPASSGVYTTREVGFDTLISTYTSGDAVKYAARAIDRVSANLLFVRRNHTAVAATKTVTQTIAGTAVATISGTPDEAREFIFTVTTGDTVVGGIDYSLSLDGTESTGTIASTGILSLGGGLTLTLDPPANALVALANDVRAVCLTHFPKTAGSVHGAADNASDDGFAAVATTNATAMTLANTLRTGILAHLALGSLTHSAADTTNGTGIPAAATTLQATRILLIALKAALNAHAVDLTYHGLADAVLVTEASPSSGTLSTSDEILVSTTDPSPAVVSLLKSGGGTLTVTSSGTPLETFSARVEFLNAGVVGVDGGQYRVSLDDGNTWQPNADLGVATSIVVQDHRRDYDGSYTTTGVTLVLVGAETFTATTVITFRTTGPQVAIADVITAIGVAAASSFRARGWRFFHVIGNYTRAEMAQVQTVLNSLQGSKIWSYAIMQSRDKRPSEIEADWMAELVTQRALLDANRVAPCAGYARSFTCPITGRLDRRPAAWLDAIRRLCVGVDIESGRFVDGPLGSEVKGKVGGEGSSGDVTLYENGERVEYDANTDATLANARITVLRTFDNGGTGTYVNGSRMGTGAASKFTRTRDRELMDEGARALANEGFRKILDTVRRNPGDYPTDPAQPGDPGTILEADALDIELQARSAVKSRIGSKANSVTLTVDRTNDLTGNNGPRIISEVCSVEGKPVIEQVSASLVFLG